MFTEDSRHTKTNPWLNLETQQFKDEVNVLQKILQEINET